MVYSTCSLNPIENEAVISAILEKSEGEPFHCSTVVKCKVVDWSCELKFCIRAQL